MQEGVLYRQVNKRYKEDYDLLMQSGLYDTLLQRGWLISHVEVDSAGANPELAYKILQPERVPLITYPYEWSFSQLKDAALLTLAIQKKALDKGLSLKDASAYNIQFIHGKPSLIDTLSFEKYKEGTPWVAYRQFCQHFLGPLALMAMVDVRLSQLLRIYIDGIPLDLASRLLPFRSRINFGIMAHIHLHASSQKRFADKPISKPDGVMTRSSLVGLIENLSSTVRNLNWKPGGTEWGEYYDHTNYNDEAMQDKKAIVGQYIQKIDPQEVWDLGANTGFFSRIASEKGIPTAAYDIDPTAVENNYREIKAKKERNLLPLVIDLTNPSPALGWANSERMGFGERGPVDCVMALALIHHLAISNNLPLPKIAAFFSGLCRWLIIEFVPKSDSQVQRLLTTREDIFEDYDEPHFEEFFAPHFSLIEKQPVKGTSRALYLFKTR